MEIPVEKQIRRRRELPEKKEDNLCRTLVQEENRNLHDCHNRLVKKLKAQFVSLSHLETVFAGLLSHVIVDDTKGELEKKF